MNRYIAFLKAFERNSFSDAARDLGYTQSAVSQMIKSLEAELGVTLLVRSRSGVTLTYEGRHLLPYIRDTVNAYRMLQSQAAGFSGLEQGTIRLGTFTSVSSYPAAAGHGALPPASTAASASSSIRACITRSRTGCARAWSTSASRICSRTTPFAVRADLSGHHARRAARGPSAGREHLHSGRRARGRTLHSSRGGARRRLHPRPAYAPSADQRPVPCGRRLHDPEHGREPASACPSCRRPFCAAAASASPRAGSRRSCSVPSVSSISRRPACPPPDRCFSVSSRPPDPERARLNFFARVCLHGRAGCAILKRCIC